MSKELLTASRMNTLLACPRRHYWRYEIGLQANTDSDALRFGSAWHAAMEARWRGAPCDQVIQTAVNDSRFEEIQLATLAGLLCGYYALYAQDIVKELHPEVEFRHAIEGSRTFDSAGKIDGLAVLHDGRLALLEHKTCGEDISAESDYWLRLRFNQQVYQYVLAARALGWDVSVVLYDVTRKPSIRQKQNECCEEYMQRLEADCKERPDFYFARREVPILEQDLAEFEVQRYELSKLILALRQAEKRVSGRQQAWPRNVNGMTCKFCEFSPFCLQNISVDTDQPPAGFRVGPAHSELNQEGT